MLYRMTIPKMPSHCQECGRELDGRMIDNPFGAWAVPTSWVKDDKRIVTCAVCQSGGPDAVRKLLPAGCVALDQLERFLALKGN